MSALAGIEGSGVHGHQVGRLGADRSAEFCAGLRASVVFRGVVGGQNAVGTDGLSAEIGLEERAGLGVVASGAATVNASQAEIKDMLKKK